MVDTQPMMKQVEDLQIIIHELHAEGYSINEQFQVGSNIEKLPPSWKDFKIYLKYKRHATIMEDLILRLRVEEDQRKGDIVDGVGANIIKGEHVKPKFQKFKDKKKTTKMNKPLTA